MTATARPNIWIGTSGFQYKEWKGSFYPEKLATKKMLAFYGQHLPTTEINYTFKAIPTAKVTSNWSAETPTNFRFTLKAPQEITHFKKLRECDDVIGRFWEAAGTLNEKLGVILFQLPPYFKRDVGVLTDFLASLPHSMKCAFEFRHDSWFTEDVFASLRFNTDGFFFYYSQNKNTTVVMTADYAYFRLRDEGYTKKDIEHWAKVIGAEGKKVTDAFVYFKHEESGVGPKFAAQLMELFGPQAVRSAKS